MRIGISTFGGDGGRSGVSQYIIELLRELPAAAPEDEFEVLILDNEDGIYFQEQPRMRAVRVSSKLRNPFVNLAWQQAVLPGLCRKRGWDVLFVPAGNRRMPFWTPCPRVGNFLDFCAAHIPGKYDFVHSVYNFRVLPMLVRHLSLVLTISESSKRDLVELIGVPEERIVLTPLGADVSRYHPRDKAEAQRRVAQRYNINAPYFLYLARIEHPGKNHVPLIRAFDRVKSEGAYPHRLVLAGSDWSRAEDVHHAAEACRCHADIVFTGFAPTQDLPDLYAGADAFVYPSLYEGFGMPVLEAMACGTPVACSNVSSLPEVTGDTGLLFDPTDETAIADALRVLMSDPAAREELGRRGYARSKEFSWRKTADLTIEALRRAVREARP